MSVVIAIKTGDGVLVGADSQTSFGEYEKEHKLAENNFKITRMPHGILLGHAGEVRATQVLSCHKDWFEELGDEPLTKEFLVTKISPRLSAELRRRGLTDEDGDYNGQFLVAQGDRIFNLNSDFSVFTIPTFAAIGSGLDAAFLARAGARCGDERETVLAGLRLAAKNDKSVGAPFILIDTVRLAYEIVEG